MKVITSYLILFFLLFAGFMSPQKPMKKNNKQITIKLNTSDPQSEFEQELKKYKDSIILCATAVEESKKVIYLNEPYLKNLDKKIEELKKEKTLTAQKSKEEIIIPQNSIEVKVYHLDSTCLETRNWLGRQLKRDECRTYKVDTLWATIKLKK